jgi:hypothetical protein
MEGTLFVLLFTVLRLVVPMGILLIIGEMFARNAKRHV